MYSLFPLPFPPHTVDGGVIYLNDTVGGGRSIGRVLIMR